MPNPDDYIGFLISDVARLMRTVFDRRVHKLGLTRAQWMVLTRLHRHSGASQSELADMLEMEKASAGRLIDRLEAKGWVERRVHASDRRINRIYLTREAERVHKRIWKIAESTVEDALVDLSARESAQLSKLLATVKTRLLENVDKPFGRGVREGSAAAPRQRSAAPIRLPDAPAAIEGKDDEVIVP